MSALDDLSIEEKHIFYSRLEKSCREGKIEEIKSAIDMEANINFNESRPESSFLSCAIEGQSIECVEYLLDMKADITYKDNVNIKMACYKGNLEILKLLIQRGASVFEAYKDKRSHGFYWAVMANSEPIVHYLLDLGAIPFYNINQDALKYAASRDNASMVKLLITKAGGDIDRAYEIGGEKTRQMIEALKEKQRLEQYIIPIEHIDANESAENGLKNKEKEFKNPNKI